MIRLFFLCWYWFLIQISYQKLIQKLTRAFLLNWSQWAVMFLLREFFLTWATFLEVFLNFFLYLTTVIIEIQKSCDNEWMNSIIFYSVCNKMIFFLIIFRISNISRQEVKTYLRRSVWCWIERALLSSHLIKFLSLRLRKWRCRPISLLPFEGLYLLSNVSCKQAITTKDASEQSWQVIDQCENSFLWQTKAWASPTKKKVSFNIGTCQYCDIFRCLGK